jgi:hypothetical protein
MAGAFGEEYPSESDAALLNAKAAAVVAAKIDGARIVCSSNQIR